MRNNSVMRSTLSELVKDPVLNWEGSSHGAELLNSFKRLLDADEHLIMLQPALRSVFENDKPKKKYSLEEQHRRLHKLRTDADTRSNFCARLEQYQINPSTSNMAYFKVLQHFFSG